jgi:Cu/Ag efflux pump CusA
LHARSALVAIITLPLGVLMAYICMWVLGLSSNIMSLGGIAIAIGAMVDAAIVMIENAHKHLERAPEGKPRTEILIDAAVEVGPALFFSLLIITVSFLPIFALEAQEGRLFRPLAYTKTFAMAAAALLSIAVVINLLSGLALLAAYPAKALTNWVFFLKLALVAAALWVLEQTKGELLVATGAATTTVSTRARQLAALSILFWCGAIFAGRLLAYTHSILLASEGF